MKKLIILLLITIVMSSCSQKCEHEEEPATINGIKTYTYTFDGCEYIGSVRGVYSDKLTHKGNCKYCIERNNNK